MKVSEKQLSVDTVRVKSIPFAVSWLCLSRNQFIGTYFQFLFFSPVNMFELLSVLAYTTKIRKFFDQSAVLGLST